MTVVGADPDQLRTTANQFMQAADRLQGSMKGLTGFVSNAAIWRGPDSERFRSEWNGQSVSALSAAINTLHAGAEVLRRNADEQEDASRADGAGGSAGLGGIDYEPAANGLHDMWSEIHDIPGESSGYRVQKVVGADEVERYIVYISGTKGVFDPVQGWGDNIDAISGGVDQAQLDALDRLIPDDAEVMMVGYSQGGIEAQNIAASERLNVTQVVTFGSPVRNDLNISAIHLGDGYDPVPGAGIVNPQLYSGTAQEGNGNVEVFSARSSSDSPFGFVEHEKGYEQLSTDWDNAARDGTDARAATSAAGLGKFQGDVVDQVDIAVNGDGSW